MSTNKIQEASERYKEILQSLNLKKTYEKYGEQHVKWALNKFLKNQREKATYLKQKNEALEKLKEIEDNES